MNDGVGRDDRQLWPRAVALYQAGRWLEALACCRELLALAPATTQLLGLAGMLAMRLDDASAAVDFLARAVEQKPDSTELHYNHGNALVRLGRAADGVEAYRRALALQPDLLPAHNNLGAALQSLERSDEAITVFRHAISLAADNPELRRNLGIALEAAGRRDEAVVAYRHAQMLRPHWPAIHRNLANALLESGAADEARAVCEAWLALEPGNLEAIGLMAVALDELGDRAGAARVVDLDHFVRRVEISPPPGYHSLDAFNHALVEQILADPSLSVPAVSAPHYNGPAFRTTDELFDRAGGALNALKEIVRRESEDYLAALAPAHREHPYFTHPPMFWRPTAMATVLDHGGNLAPHVHYSGYVSGVYYVRIPAFVAASQADHAGWFEIGRPPARFLRRGRPDVRLIEPREGTMLLFPAYFFHSTVPFHVAETRISIAFDATPTPIMTSPGGVSPVPG
jgi:Flp pilus assembly protein TadD